MARLKKQKQQQLNIDSKFSGYSTAQVEANKAEMEKGLREFDAAKHLRQLDEQDRKQSTKGSSMDERSDNETLSRMDPSVSMFEVA